MEKVDAAGEEQENCSKSQRNAIKDNKEEKIADGSPEIFYWLILPVTILYIPKDICIGSQESCNEAHEICKRDDDLKTFTNDKNLNTHYKLFNILFSRVSFCPKCLDDKVEVDEKIYAKKNINCKISCKTSNTHREKNCVIGDSW